MKRNSRTLTDSAEILWYRPFLAYVITYAGAADDDDRISTMCETVNGKPHTFRRTDTWLFLPVHPSVQICHPQTPTCASKEFVYS